jgi:hypothetical protein
METMNQINDETFAYLVAEEVKNKLSSSQRDILMQKENWYKWQRCLLALISNIDDQLSDLIHDEENDRELFDSIGSRRLQTKANDAYKGRRNKIERFKFHVNKRLDQVTAMIETGSSVESNGWEQVDFLKSAIAKHRAMMNENDLEATPIDIALWSALSNNWGFDNIDTSNL